MNTFIKLSFLFLSIASAGLLSAEKHYEFTSADGSKTFRASVRDYDSDSGIVEVINNRGKIMKFKASILCDEDKEYIEKMAPIVKVGQSIRVSMDSDRKKIGVSEKGDWECTTHDYVFDIALRNIKQKSADQFEVHYTIYIENTSRFGKKTIRKVTGDQQINYILGDDTDIVKTKPARLKKWVYKPNVGG